MEHCSFVSLPLGKVTKQAGMSRATLDISLEVSNNFPLKTQKSNKLKFVKIRLVGAEIFNHLRSSSIGHFLFWYGFPSLILKFEEDLICGC